MVRLAHGAIRIDVGSAERAVLEWLVEFLGPAFEERSADAAAPDHLVRFDAAPVEHAELHALLASAPAGEIEGFTLDGEFTRHRAFVDRHGLAWAHDDSHDVFFCVEPGGRTVRVVAPRPDGGPRVALMRVVRELATVALLRSGRLPVHGAAFALDGGAVLLCGPKRSGKSSLLVHALRGGGEFLSNDRVFVDVGAAPAARGMPTIVMLRDGTLDRFAGLTEAFERARFDRSRAIAECAPGVDRPEPKAGAGFDRPGVSPAQFCRLLGAPMRAEAPVALLLFPRIDASADGLVLERLDSVAALRAMEKSLLVPSHPVRLSPLFAPGSAAEPIAAAAVERCRRLVEQVPAYACRLGRDAYRGDLADALREALGPTTSSAPGAPRRGSGGR